MSVIRWAHDRSRAMTLWDVGFLKVSAMLFGVLVGAYGAPFVTRNVWWFVAALLVLGGRVGYRWFAADPPRASAAASR